ncbi:MAG: hypothetical protein RLZZ540_110 [Bacteroidota bacterium]|jgi:hypothetical protein
MKKTIFSFAFALLTLASCSNDDGETVEIPTVGETLEAGVGGANQPNQVYVDLSAAKFTAINRTSWDFGFYSGSEFRVILNGSVKMAVKKLETTDITLAQTVDNGVNVSYNTVASNGYVDNPTGVLTGAGLGEGTAIAEVSATDSENKVYLVNLGFAISTETPDIGSVSVDGASRGWKKVRILRNGNGYKIQYADLASTTFTEKTIAKDTDFNFSFFSLNTAKTVSVEPEKNKWDLNFTTFTNYLPYMGVNVTYAYSDFIVSNRLGGTKVYQVLIAGDVTYTAFAKANIVETNFDASVLDQRAIGANWRNGGGQNGSLPSIKTDRFYVLKDAAGNYYKLKFLAMTNVAGERGHVTFEYAILN